MLEPMTPNPNPNSSQSPISEFAQSTGTHQDQDSPTQQTCPTCQESVSTEVAQCPNCEHTINPSITARWSTTTDSNSWTLDRVVFAIVPAQSKHVALPQATGLFESKLGGSRDLPTSGDNYDLIDNVNLADTVQHAWGNLPGAAQLTSEDGQAILATIQSQLDTPSTSSYASAKRPHLYGKYGQELDVDTVATYTDADLADGKRYWIVPALAYVIKQSGSVPDDTEDLFCADCGQKTPHTFEGREGRPTWADEIHHNGDIKSSGPPLETLHYLEDTPGRPVWQCWECDSGQFGPEPEHLDSQTIEDKHDRGVDTQVPDGAEIPDEIDEPEITADDFPKVERGPEDAHEYHLQQLEDRGQNVPTTTSRDSDS